MSCKLKPATWSCDTHGSVVTLFDRCQLTITRMLNIKEYSLCDNLVSPNYSPVLPFLHFLREVEKLREVEIDTAPQRGGGGEGSGVRWRVDQAHSFRSSAYKYRFWAFSSGSPLRNDFLYLLLLYFSIYYVLFWRSGGYQSFKLLSNIILTEWSLPRKSSLVPSVTNQSVKNILFSLAGN